MVSSSLLTFFGTLAQVSFTVSGLMAVAIAGDSKRRDYWFAHESRSLFVYISFLILLLPGFISIGGLIPPTPDSNVPSWVSVTFILGFLYLTLAVGFFFRKRKLAEPEEFKRLEKRFSKVNSELGIFGLAMLAASIGGWAGSYTSATTEYGKVETWLGIILFIAAISGALASVVLLRANEKMPDKINIDNVELLSTKTSANIEERVSDSGIHVLTSLLLSIIAFLIGFFLKSKDK